jgi:hypothetical protein
MNQALLARQCRRIVKNPNSLCARLLKSIYFLRGNFLNTVFRWDASTSWQGIEHGLALIKEGLVTRVELAMENVSTSREIIFSIKGIY